MSNSNFNEPQNKKSSYGVIPSYILDDDSLDHGAVRLYAFIAMYSEEGRAWPSNRHLEEKLKCSDRCIQKWLKQLAEAEYIEIDIDKSGFQTTRIIWLKNDFKKQFTRRTTVRPPPHSDSPPPASQFASHNIETNNIYKEQQQPCSVVAVFSCLKDNKLALTDEDQATIMRYNFSEERLIAACEFIYHPAYEAKKSIISTIIWHCKSPSPPRHAEIAPQKENAAKAQEIDPEIIEERRSQFKKMRSQKWDLLKSKQLYCEDKGNILNIGESKLSLLDKNFDNLYHNLLKQYNLN